MGRALEVELECGHLKQRFDLILVDSPSLTELTGGTEAIFVSDVANFVDDAVWASVAVASLHDLSELVADGFDVALLVGSDAVRRFVAVNWICQLD